jgi:hemolysin III
MATQKEERLNTLTHLLALIAALAFSAWLIVFASIRGEALTIISISIFCLSMIVLYLASTLYHVSKDETKKRRLKVFDHSAIFALIAGSYTPFALVGLGGAWGWSLFGVVWGLALAGILFKLFFTGRFKLISTLLYIGMGWLVVIAAKPMGRSLTPKTIAWLAAGGLAYTLGTLFYLNKKIPHTHAIWHLFVVAGTAAHAVAVASLL